MNSDFSILHWDGVPRGRVRIELPRSKSILNRALILSALYPDRFKALRIEPEDLEIEDVALLYTALNQPELSFFDFGLAGTSARFFLAYACAQGLEIEIDASGRGRERPLAPLIDALRALGAEIEELGEAGHFPLRIRSSSLKEKKVALDGRVSSQFASALMMIAPSLEHGLEIGLSAEAVSESYIDLTAQMMRRSGFSLSKNPHSWTVQAASSLNARLDLHVDDRDWSGVIYFVQALILGCCDSLEFTGLQKTGLQADEVLIEILKPLGVHCLEGEEGLVFTREPNLRAMPETTWDARTWPDLAVGWAHLVQAVGGAGRINGLSTLNSKESKRLDALAARLSRHGLAERPDGDQLRLENGRVNPERLAFDSLGDHRLAMSCAAWSVFGELSIRGASTVVKSFPRFWVEMSKLGIGFTSGHPTAVEHTKD